MKLNKKSIIVISVAAALVIAVGVLAFVSYSSEKVKRWHGKETHFSMSVASAGKSGANLTTKRVDVLEDGSVKATEMDSKGIGEQTLGKLSDKELEDLFNFVVQTNDFFSIDQTPKESGDYSLGTLTIIVKGNGNSKTISGTTPFKSTKCKNIVNELSNIESKLKANKK